MADTINRNDEEYGDAMDGFMLFIQMAAAVARGADPKGEFRTHLAEIVPMIEKEGNLQLADSLEKLWAGERDPGVLTKDLEPRSAEVILEVLETAKKATPAEVVAGLPDGLRQAMLSGDDEAVLAGIDALSEEDQAVIFEQFVEAGFFGPTGGDMPSMEEIVDSFDALLIAAAEIAKGAGDADLRTEVLSELEYMAKNGLDIVQAVEKVWAGARDADALTKDMDTVDGALIARLLDLIEK